MKRMKDIIPISQHYIWKPDYLNRPVEEEMRRRECFRFHYRAGKTYFQAEKLARRGIK